MMKPPAKWPFLLAEEAVTLRLMLPSRADIEYNALS
jgi:hypothetical protein